MQGISKSFPGVQALADADLALRPGTVHALCGENGAGKSTLMKCLFGIYSKDTGTIHLDGKEVNFENPKAALEGGVSMVHQELNQVLARSVMENIWLGRFPMKGKLFIDDKTMYTKTKEIFESLSMTVDPRARVDSLSVSQRQMIEIAKAVSYNARVVVFDEPTSSLTDKEVEHLFEIIRTLKERGIAMVYITHKMSEIKQIADDVTVMRDGRVVYCDTAENTSIDTIITQMVGRELKNLYPEKPFPPSDETLLEVKDLNGYYEPTIKEASFELKKKEILGVVGLLGSRRTELIETVFGLRRKASGEVFLEGKKVENKDCREAVKNGFALLTEERRLTGIYENLDVEFNTTAAHLPDYTNKLGILDGRNMKSDTDRVIDMLKVKTPSTKTKISNLSGGNQQKVIFGRWMLNDFKVLMLDEPTRGIDVGAKYEIYQLMIDIAKEGNGVIFISSEMPEVIGVADRIMVMSNGHIAGVLDNSKRDVAQKDIMELCIKYL